MQGRWEDGDVDQRASRTGEACGFVPGAIVGMYHLANIATPIAVLLFGKGAQHSEQSPVEPLDLTVALWMIGSRAGV